MVGQRKLATTAIHRNRTSKPRMLGFFGWPCAILSTWIKPTNLGVAPQVQHGPLSPRRLVWPRTPAFHAGDRGSNPLGDARLFNQHPCLVNSVTQSFEPVFSSPFQLSGKRSKNGRKSYIQQNGNFKLGIKFYFLLTYLPYLIRSSAKQTLGRYQFEFLRGDF